MDDIKFTPQGWHWKITPEQIEKIKERDRDTINKVYFDNLDKFRGMADGYCARKFKGLETDCCHQIYCDLMCYDFRNCYTLWRSIWRSFWRACHSTKFEVLSLDMPLFDDDEDGTTLVDTIPMPDTVENTIERRENEKNALAIIAAQDHLSGKNKDILTAIAFNCLVYNGLFAYEYNKAFAV